MNAAERRNEIISILLVRHHITVKELAGEFDVTIRTIKNDIQALSFAYPIYTKPGVRVAFLWEGIIIRISIH